MKFKIIVYCFVAIMLGILLTYYISKRCVEGQSGGSNPEATATYIIPLTVVTDEQTGSSLGLERFQAVIQLLSPN
jgi:hypothetical protein